MKEFIENLGSKIIPQNGMLGFIVEVGYVIVMGLISIFLPDILPGEGKIGVTGFQYIFFITAIVVPIYFMCKDGGFSIGSGGTGSTNKKYGDQGTAKKGTVNEMKGLSGKDGIILSAKTRMSADKSCEHVAIIGPTGSGKSSCFYIPNLLKFDGTWSAVVTDPKAEMYDLCGPYLRSIGYKTIVLRPTDPDNPDTYFYNPLTNTENPDELSKIAQIILTNGGKSIEQATGASSGGAEWISMAQPLFDAALIYGSQRPELEKRTIYDSVKFIMDSTSLAIMEAKLKEYPAAYDKFTLFKASSGSEKTMSSIKVTLASNVQLFFRETCKKFTSAPLHPYARDNAGNQVLDRAKLFDPLVIRREKVVVFICCPETQSIDQMPLMSVLYSQILEKCMDNKEGQPIMFLLDEFANIGIIPTIASIAATARSRRISLSIGLQGMEQLAENYGKDKATNLLNNLKTKLVFSGLTGDSAEYISTLAGITTVETKNFSKNSGQGLDIMGSNSSSKSGTQRQLYTADEIRRLPDDSVLIIAHNRNPILDKKNSWYKIKEYKDKVNSFKDKEE